MPPGAPSEDLPEEPGRRGPVVALVGSGRGGRQVLRIDVQEDVTAVDVEDDVLSEVHVDPRARVCAPLARVDRAADVSGSFQLQGVVGPSPEDVEAETRKLHEVE